MKICPSCGTSYDDTTVFCPADGASLRSSSDDGELVGSVIADRYLVTGKLGQGGMGSVYLAQHVRLPQQVAIKVLHRALTFDADSIARFNREAQHASSINNEHVARIYDFGELDGGAYLAMEYVQGETLSALLERNGALPPPRVADIVKQIADGLDAAHKLGIVHRDLKPDNILISTDENGVDHVKVVDFGIAKATNKPGQSVTQTGLAIGTAEFMSPEQVAGEIVDRRTDVYALGLVTFVMLTGRLPFQGQTKEMSMLMRLTHDPHTLGEMKPDVSWPVNLQAAITRALKREVSERHETAGEFARHVMMATPRSVPALKETPVGVASSRPGKNRTVIIGSVAAALVAVVALVFFLTRPKTDAVGEPPGSSSMSQAGSSQSAGSPNSPGSSQTDSSGASGSNVAANRSDSIGSASGRTNTPVNNASQGNRGAGVADGSGARATTAGSSASTSNSAATDSLVRETMASITRNVEPLSMTAQTARQALSDISRILPQLRTGNDSATVELQRIEAHIKLEDKDQACRYIQILTPRVLTQDRRALERYRTQMGC